MEAVETHEPRKLYHITPVHEMENETNLFLNQSHSINNQSLGDYDQDNQNLSNSQVPHPCFFPTFCSDSADVLCYNQTLATCDQCSYVGFVIFGFLAGLLGLAMLVMNSLVLWQVIRKKTKSTYDKIRASLAVADVIAGLQPLVISLYYLHFTIHSTPHELEQISDKLKDSPQAIAGGIFYLLGLSSSLYHLLFLSLQRAFSLKWPLKYKMQKSRTVFIGLGIVWVLAIMASASPTWVSDKIQMFYHREQFLFAFNSKSYTNILTMLSVPFLLPFFTMSCFMIYSAILIRRNAAKSKKLSGRNSNEAAHNKREASMLKTVALMQVGFTVTLLPIGIAVLKDPGIASSPSCIAFHTTRLVCYYLAMSNSVVNPIIYSIRDKEFRKFILQCFLSKKRYVRVLAQNTDMTQVRTVSNDTRLP